MRHLNHATSRDDTKGTGANNMVAMAAPTRREGAPSRECKGACTATWPARPRPPCACLRT